ncbi:MAG: phospholipase D-like domain-containing protein [Methanobacterium sp.]|nr:phospholipase D-like domain-containing protein [Methanobacterium sp.]
MTTLSLKLLDKGQILANIKKRILKTDKNIYIIGPWLDAYFTREIIHSLPHPEIEVNFLVRKDEGVIDGKTLSALNLARMNITHFQARSLEKLHSKVIVIDNETFYLGSANWYWYSLNKTFETTITGNIPLLSKLIPQIEEYWDIATPISEDEIKKHCDFEPVKEDLF